MWLKPTHWCYLFFITGFSYNFKGNQQTCPQEREENYFADTENSPYMLSEDDSTSLSDPDNWSETPNGWWFKVSFDRFPRFIIDSVVFKEKKLLSRPREKSLTWKREVLCVTMRVYINTLLKCHLQTFSHKHLHSSWDD